jgi:hypothetical protein
MKDLEAFATSELSEAGVIIPLMDVEGNPTEHWIKIKGVDSNAFRKAQSSFRKRALELHELESNNPDRDYSKQIEKETNKLLASLVVDWSFKNDDGTPYECSESNIVDVLEKAPVLANEIDAASAKRKNFIKRSLNPSGNLQSKNSSSKKSPRKAKSAS